VERGGGTKVRKDQTITPTGGNTLLPVGMEEHRVSAMTAKVVVEIDDEGEERSSKWGKLETRIVMR
jgi:hypothetical protein